MGENMNSFKKFLRKLFCVSIGALAAAFFLAVFNGTVDFCKNKLGIEECSSLKQEYKEVENKINEINSFIADAERTPFRVLRRCKAIYYRNVILPKLEIRRLEIEIKLGKANTDALGECIVKNLPSVPRYTINIFFLIIFCPLILSLMMYYIFARYIEGFHPIIAERNNTDKKQLNVSDSNVSIDIKLDYNQHLYLRGG